MLPEVMVGIMEASRYPQALQAMYAQAAIYDSVFIHAHFRGANRVKDGGADIASLFCQLFTAFKFSAGQKFFGNKRRKRFLRDNISGDSNRLSGGFAILIIGQIIWRNMRAVKQVGRAQADIPARMRAQIYAYRCGKGREGMQGLAKRI